MLPIQVIRFKKYIRIVTKFEFPTHAKFHSLRFKMSCRRKGNKINFIDEREYEQQRRVNELTRNNAILRHRIMDNYKWNKI